MLPVDADDLIEANVAALVTAAQGDPPSFADLYRLYLKRVYLYVRANVANAEDAADLTQQIFLQAFHHLASFRQQSSFRSWLFRIAQHSISNFHRRRPHTVPWETLPETVHPLDEQTPETLALWHESVARLQHLLAQLPTDKRDLLALRFAAQLHITEIAEILEKTQKPCASRSREPSKR
jgi:RNA polymerase sigma-70 factor, ECF subfamily